MKFKLYAVAIGVFIVSCFVGVAFAQQANGPVRLADLGVCDTTITDSETPSVLYHIRCLPEARTLVIHTFDLDAGFDAEKSPPEIIHLKADFSVVGYSADTDALFKEAWGKFFTIRSGGEIVGPADQYSFH